MSGVRFTGPRFRTTEGDASGGGAIDKSQILDGALIDSIVVGADVDGVRTLDFDIWPIDLNGGVLDTGKDTQIRFYLAKSDFQGMGELKFLSLDNARLLIPVGSPTGLPSPTFAASNQTIVVDSGTVATVHAAFETTGLPAGDYALSAEAGSIIYRTLFTIT